MRAVPCMIVCALALAVVGCAGTDSAGVAGPTAAPGSVSSSLGPPSAPAASPLPPALRKRAAAICRVVSANVPLYAPFRPISGTGWTCESRAKGELVIVTVERREKICSGLFAEGRPIVVRGVKGALYDTGEVTFRLDKGCVSFASPRETNTRRAAEEWVANTRR